MKLGKFHLQEVNGEELKFYIQLILDQYSEKTKRSIALYDSENEEIWCNTTSTLAPLCQECRLDKALSNLCLKDHIKRSSIEFYTSNITTKSAYCHFGLLNYSTPIIYENKYYGSLLSGQIKDSTSLGQQIFKDTINALYNNKQISDDKSKRLNAIFYNTRSEQNNEKIITYELNNTTIRLNNLIEYVDNRLDRRLRRITNLRHEIHLPNKALQGYILESIEILTKAKKSVTDVEANEAMASVIRNLSFANNYSELFSNTIENIISSFTKDTVAKNTGRCFIFDTLNSSIAIFSKDAEDKNIKFIPIDKKNTTVISIIADCSLLKRVFTNVYQNAAKYSFKGTPESPRWIETKCSETNDFFIIEVQNYGIGILPEEISSGNIWKEGTRGKLSGDRHRIGTGTGLYIIQKFIHAHHGTVEISSTPLGENKITGPYLTRTTIKIPFYQNE